MHRTIPRRIYSSCKWSGRRERPGQAGAGIETGAQRLARRGGERYAQQGLLREQRQGNKRSRARRLTSHAGELWARRRRFRQQRRETGRSGDQGRQMRVAGQLQRYTDGTFDGPQDFIPDTRPPAGASARGSLLKQKPDATSKHLFTGQIHNKKLH